MPSSGCKRFRTSPGVEQQLPKQTVGAAYGDALLVAIGTGHASADTDWARTASVVTPSADSRGVYDELFLLYEELYATTADLVHRLARFGDGLSG